MKIISIDDSEQLFVHLKEMLKSIQKITFAGHTDNIENGKKLLESIKPQVVFLDIAIKEENGLELLSYIKSKYPDTIVIMLSNYAEIFYKNKSKELGADYFLDKSYEFDKIPQILERIKN
jgi:DNA-binding NarL/FixJ family response regulator